MLRPWGRHYPDVIASSGVDMAQTHCHPLGSSLSTSASLRTRARTRSGGVVGTVWRADPPGLSADVPRQRPMRRPPATQGDLRGAAQRCGRAHPAGVQAAPSTAPGGRGALAAAVPWAQVPTVVQVLRCSVAVVLVPLFMRRPHRSGLWPETMKHIRSAQFPSLVGGGLPKADCRRGRLPARCLIGAQSALVGSLATFA